MSSLSVFRDPIYNYIPYSRLEGQVVDSALFQRLRYVSQNALAHLTYEMNRTSRFSHSLGCMHVGGRLLLAGIRNSEPDVSELFMAECDELVSGVCRQSSVRPSLIRDFLRDDRDPFYVHSGLGPIGSGPALRDVTSVAILEGVRLACVIHDIGHPPFSHTLEGVLEAQLEGRSSAEGPPGTQTLRGEFTAALTSVRPTLDRQLHERIGEVVMDEVFSTSVTPDAAVFFQQLCLRLAKAIASGETDGFTHGHAAIWSLHQLVSGDLDADRADYIGRDGFACGFEFGTYDLERIIMSTRVVRDGPRFKFRPSSTALSAVESFFLERLRIYRWLVFHHNVVRGHVALQRAMHLLLDLCLSAAGDEPESTIRLRRFLADELPRLWTPFHSSRTDVAQYKRVDENWLLALFGKVLDHPSLQSDRLPEPLALLRTYLLFVCEREKGLLPVWKRLSGYRRFADALRLEAENPAYEPFFSLPQNAGLQPGAASSVEFTNALLKKQLAVRQDNLIVIGGELALLERFEQEVEAAWPSSACPGKVVFHFASRMRPGPTSKDEEGCVETSFALVDEGNSLVDIRELSPQVAALESVWAKDIQAFAFVIPGERTGTDFVVSKAGLDTATVTKELAQAVAKVLLRPQWRPSVLVAV